MEAITSTTEKGREGFNISWSAEQEFGKKLLKELPQGWKVKIGWIQILFSDVQYEIDFKKKVVDVTYNQNLRHWSDSMIKEIKSKITKKK